MGRRRRGGGGGLGRRGTLGGEGRHGRPAYKGPPRRWRPHGVNRSTLRLTGKLQGKATASTGGRSCGTGPLLAREGVDGPPCAGSSPTRRDIRNKLLPKQFLLTGIHEKKEMPKVVNT